VVSVLVRAALAAATEVVFCFRGAILWNVVYAGQQ